jgi:hypothetical protein
MLRASCPGKRKFQCLTWLGQRGQVSHVVALLKVRAALLPLLRRRLRGGVPSAVTPRQARDVLLARVAKDVLVLIRGARRRRLWARLNHESRCAHESISISAMQPGTC